MSTSLLSMYLQHCPHHHHNLFCTLIILHWVCTRRRCGRQLWYYATSLIQFTYYNCSLEYRKAKYLTYAALDMFLLSSSLLPSLSSFSFQLYYPLLIGTWYMLLWTPFMVPTTIDIWMLIAQLSACIQSCFQFRWLEFDISLLWPSFVLLWWESFIICNSFLSLSYILVFLPTIYPFEFFQKFLLIFPICLRAFVDSFQGIYKDGTEPETSDCQWFVQLRLFIRLTFFSSSI